MARKKKEIDPNDPNQEERQETSARRLLFDACWTRARPWKSPDGDLFVDVHINGQKRTFPIKRSEGTLFVAWLRSIYTEITRGSIAPQKCITEVVDEFMARALMSANVIKPDLRVAGDDQTVYIDCGEENSRVVKITKDGWSYDDGSPHKFVRGQGMLPLVQAVQGSPLPAALKRFIHVRTDEDMALLIGWLVGSMNPNGPYPILVLTGEQGSAKSTTMRLLRRLVDPHARDMREPFDNPRDLVAAAKNSYVLAFDNVSVIRNWMADSLCRLSTGTAAIGGRALYTDADEASFTACRPIMMNGIPDFVERGDLLDRAIHVNLPRVQSYKADDLFWAEFEEELPRLQGALFNAVSMALKRLPEVVLDFTPRMSNFARWVVAAEPALDLKPGQFLQTYRTNRQSANQHMLEFNTLAQGVIRLVEDEGLIYCTYGELYAKLLQYIPKGDAPKNTYVLAAEMRRIAPALRMQGIEFHVNGRLSGGGKDRGKTAIELRKMDEQADPVLNGTPKEAGGVQAPGTDPQRSLPAGGVQSGHEGRGPHPEGNGLPQEAPGTSLPRAADQGNQPKDD